MEFSKKNIFFLRNTIRNRRTNASQKHYYPLGQSQKIRECEGGPESPRSGNVRGLYRSKKPGIS